tara:strand:- start:63 stop:269 length:207 start_codon:yes stop_codon:yes gene_type:complete
MFNHLDKELYFEFLNELRESGTTNMFGAASNLENEFPELNRQEAKEVFYEWIESFDKNDKFFDKVFGG